MKRRYDNILQTIGDTPAIRINKLAPGHVELFVKMESFNPMGSVKDRLALAVIEDAERRGELKPGHTVVEASSGNTGIGLAMVCAQKGYPLVITMAENFSIERRKLMRFLGARVVLTPASEKGTGMVNKAVELAQKHGWWLARQFDNPANPDFHAKTTAIEILRDFDEGLDYWVTGFGTAGTLNGVSRVLKQESPETKIIVCEPDNSAILASGIVQARGLDGNVSGSHPAFRPHVMQGWSPDFISRIAQEVLDNDRIDDFLAIDGNDALHYARELARKEGIFVGITSGATFAGALQIAKEAPAGSRILCMLPDTGERYMTTPLFADVAEEMTEEEKEISRSTAGYRFDVSSSAPPAPVQHEAAPEAARQELQKLIRDPQRPIVMFGLEWCEFCWSVRKLFERYNIPYHAVNLDSVAYQRDNRGGSLRAALREHTGWNTLPQLFVGNEFVGGCTDVSDECLSGRFKQRLQAVGIGLQEEISNPYEFLPKWLQKRGQ